MKQKYKDNFKKVGLFKTIKACIKGLYYGVLPGNIIYSITNKTSEYKVCFGKLIHINHNGTLVRIKKNTQEYQAFIQSHTKWAGFYNANVIK